MKLASYDAQSRQTSPELIVADEFFSLFRSRWIWVPISDGECLASHFCPLGTKEKAQLCSDLTNRFVKSLYRDLEI